MTTASGEKDFYGMVSPDSELVFSGSGALVSGTAEVKFSEDVASIIDDTQPVKVNITLTSGGVGGVYVETKDAKGFRVRELQTAGGNATFDWMVIAKRRLGEVVTEIVPSNGAVVPAVDSPVVENLVISSNTLEQGADSNSSSVEVVNDITPTVDNSGVIETSVESQVGESVETPPVIVESFTLITPVNETDSSPVPNLSGEVVAPAETVVENL
jgi:hypothetical protein